jgi:hypothetical protein
MVEPTGAIGSPPGPIARRQRSPAGTRSASVVQATHLTISLRLGTDSPHGFAAHARVGRSPRAQPWPASTLQSAGVSGRPLTRWPSSSRSSRATRAPRSSTDSGSPATHKPGCCERRDPCPGRAFPLARNRKVVARCVEGFAVLPMRAHETETRSCESICANGRSARLSVVSSTSFSSSAWRRSKYSAGSRRRSG